MILYLIKLANKLDILGYKKESRFVDKLIKESIDPGVKKLVDSEQGWTYGCPNPSCNKPVEIDEKVFSMFIPPKMTCPNCNEKFSPHDVGATRSISGAGEIEGIHEDPGKYSLKEDERGVWVLYCHGQPWMAIEGKANAERYLRRWVAGDFRDIMENAEFWQCERHTEKGVDITPFSRNLEKKIMDYPLKLLDNYLDYVYEGAPEAVGEKEAEENRRARIEEDRFVKRRIGNIKKLVEESVRRTSEIRPQADENVNSSSVIPHGEFPKKERIVKFLDDNAPEGDHSHWEPEGPNYGGIDHEIYEQLHKDLETRRRARDDGVNPEDLADDKIW